ncbi:hypothetical protein B296_00043872 [Ensete ventricosum]|uniref:Uncharacterized protein n=1 Tax=Ensete ventricosum TaxID=4639 RepID=A0A426Z368_ENSVE|nr:hypothetical protein B296_00043872 [Ensete ventricosum]
MVPSAIGASASMVATGSTVEKHAIASGSTTRVSVEKEEPMETEEALERGYTLRELCEVDCAGAEKYFTTIMVLLKATEGEDPLVPRWSAISGSSQVWTEGPLVREYLRGASHPILAKQVYECSSEDLINKVDSLDEARNDRACLDGDVLSLIEAATLLEAELKAKGPRAVAAYKVSRGFRSGLEKMGRVSYEFRYWVALKRLWGKNPKIMIQ